MEQNITVSIVCNVYNHEKYLRDALEGFVTQKTDFPFEVLVHDDASPDSSADIIREYEAKYPDIIKPIYQTENQYSQKIPINITYQIPRIRGKYVAVCEGDDYWTDPLKLQKQVDFLEAHPDYSLCACSVKWLDMRTGKALNRRCVDEDLDVTMEDLIMQRTDRTFQYASVLLRAEIFCCRPEWMKVFRVGDVPLTLHAANCGKVRMLADTMAVYRSHTPGSWTSRTSADHRVWAAALQSIINGLTAFNEATDYRYDETIRRRISMHKYNIARFNGDLQALRSGELRQIWLSRSPVTRLSDILACKAPRLHAMLVHLLKQEK